MTGGGKRPGGLIARAMSWSRCFMAASFAAQAVAAWYRPLPKWYVTFLCAGMAAFFLLMQLIMRELSKGTL